MRRMRFVVLLAALLSPEYVAQAAQSDQQPGTPQANAEGVAFFEKKIRPVLSASCYKCHSATSEKLKGGLKVDSRDALLRGGESGPAVVPGKPDESPLIHAVRYDHDDLQMPPKQKLPESAVADLAKWVEMGAPWSPSEKIVGPAGTTGAAVGG